MGSLIVEDALLREPNLWVPGERPIGRVKVTDNYKDTVLGSYIFTQSNQYTDGLDINQGYQVGNVLLNTKLGIYGSPASNSNYVVVPVTSTANPLSFNQNVSIYVRARPDEISGTGKVFIQRWGSTTVFYLAVFSTKLRFSFYDVDSTRHDVDRTTTINAGVYYDFAFVLDGTSVKLYQDGVQLGAGYSFSKNLRASATEDLIFIYSSAIDWAFTGRLEYALFLKGNQYTPENIRKDPYQFLIPA